MASEVKSDKLSPSSGTALQIGDASDTITIPTGATFTITDGLGVAGGGTGLTSFTAGDVLYASGTTTLTKLAKGSAEQVLAMNSGATAPDWGSVDLTVLPTITAAKGGTGQTSYTTGDIVYASGSTAISKLGVGTARQGLQTNAGATAPEWVNSPQSLMTAAGDILYASGANTLAKLAKGSDDDVLTLASGVPSWAAPAGGGKLLQVVQYVRTAVTGSTTSTSMTNLTDFKLAITPTAASSKILIDYRIASGNSYSGQVHTQITRDIEGGGYVTLTDFIGAATGSRTRVTAGTLGLTTSTSFPIGQQCLDSPSYTLTDEITYQWQWFTESGSTAYINRDSANADNYYNNTPISTITLMEIGA